MIVIEKKSDSGIKIHILHSGKFAKEGSEGFRHFSDAPCLKNLNPNDYFFMDENPKPKDLESRKQLFWENDANGNPQVKVDLSWGKRLMPDHLIKKKFLAKLRKMAQDAVEKEDFNTALKHKIKFDNYANIKAGAHNEDVTWLQIALDGLNEKVSKGELDKPLIREKLLNKKLELEGK